MPVAKFLSLLQQENLQNALRESEDPHQQQRVLMLLLRNDGKTYEEDRTTIKTYGSYKLKECGITPMRVMDK